MLMLNQQEGVACALASNHITKQQYYSNLFFSCTVAELTNFKFVARTQHGKHRMEEIQTKW